MGIQQIHAVSVYVSNPDQAIDYYVGKLGFELRLDQPFGSGQRWIEVGLPGGQTTLNLASGYGDDHWQERVGVWTNISLFTPNLQESYQALMAKGALFAHPPKTEDWGSFTMLLDPDGNSFMLSQPS